MDAEIFQGCVAEVRHELKTWLLATTGYIGIDYVLSNTIGVELVVIVIYEKVCSDEELAHAIEVAA